MPIRFFLSSKDIYPFTILTCLKSDLFWQTFMSVVRGWNRFSRSGWIDKHNVFVLGIWIWRWSSFVVQCSSSPSLWRFWSQFLFFFLRTNNTSSFLFKCRRSEGLPAICRNALTVDWSFLLYRQHMRVLKRPSQTLWWTWELIADVNAPISSSPSRALLPSGSNTIQPRITMTSSINQLTTTTPKSKRGIPVIELNDKLIFR